MKEKRVLRRGLSIALVLLALVMLNNAFGKHKRISSTSRFQNTLRNNNLVVGLFYVEKRKISRDLRAKIKSQRRMLRRISKADPYHYAQVMFIGVNTAKENLHQAVVRHGVPEPTPETPTLGLFLGGKIVTAARGFLTQDAIENLIDSYFGKDIKRITQQKDKQLARRLEEAKRRSYNRSYRGGPYYGWGWPYYGYGWPYRRWWGSGWGIGFGWRGGLGGRGGWRGGGCRGRCR